MYMIQAKQNGKKSEKGRKSEKGKTPLDEAYENKHKDVIAFLRFKKNQDERNINSK